MCEETADVVARAPWSHVKVVFIWFSLQIKCILSQINGHALFIHEADQHSVHSPHFPWPRLPGRKKTELNLALADTAVCLLLRVAASSTQNKPNPNVFLDSDYHVNLRRSSSSEAPLSEVASLTPDWRQRPRQRMDLWCHEWASLTGSHSDEWGDQLIH